MLVVLMVKLIVNLSPAHPPVRFEVKPDGGGGQRFRQATADISKSHIIIIDVKYNINPSRFSRSFDDVFQTCWLPLCHARQGSDLEKNLDRGWLTIAPPRLKQHSP